MLCYTSCGVAMTVAPRIEPPVRYFAPLPTVAPGHMMLLRSAPIPARSLRPRVFFQAASSPWHRSHPRGPAPRKLPRLPGVLPRRPRRPLLSLPRRGPTLLPRHRACGPTAPIHPLRFLHLVPLALHRILRRAFRPAQPPLMLPQRQWRLGRSGREARRERRARLSPRRRLRRTSVLVPRLTRYTWCTRRAAGRWTVVWSWAVRVGFGGPAVPW
jgi:hypothetical protein